MSEFTGLHAELTQQIIGVFYAVQNELGVGFVESVYQSAMVLALRQDGLRVTEQTPISVQFRGQVIGQFRADLMVNSLVLLELKVADVVTRQHQGQLLNYLRATSIEVGLVLAFGNKARHQRVYMPNTAKKHSRVDLPIRSDPLVSVLSE